MKQRWNGSIQSGNTPVYNQGGYETQDFGLYRCMVIGVLYADDPLNISMNSQNPEVLYECVILGGFQSGQTFSYCRLADWLGGDSNFSDRTLTPSSKELSKARLSEHDGDVVYILFNQGSSEYPVIIGLGKGINNKNAAKMEEGPRVLSEFNGLSLEINNQGEYSVTRKGGTLSTDTGRFTPGESFESKINLKKDEVIEVLTLSGARVIIDGKNDSIELKDKTGAGAKFSASKIALGSTSIELLQQISDQLDKLITFFNNVDATHDHIGNLGYPSSPPETAAEFTQLGTDLTTIKSNVDSIKGTL